MKDARRLLGLLTRSIPPGLGQRHQIMLQNGTLEILLWLGEICLPIMLETSDFETPIEDLAEQILLIREGVS
jgi:hypothetical protein